MKSKDKNTALACVVIVACGFALWTAANTKVGEVSEICSPTYRTVNMTDKQIFTNIYERKEWGSWSGPEVQKDEQGRHPFIDYLQDFIFQNNISTIVDMGCGYGELLKDLKLPEGSSYLGLDIVDSVIAYNQLHYKRPNVFFDSVDDIKELSNYKGDLLVLKDVIQHWSTEKIMYAKEHILPNFKYAIIVNNVYFPNLGPVNSEIITGHSRPLNLEIAPFFMKLKVIKDYKATPPRIKRIYLYVNENMNKASDDSTEKKLAK